MDSLYAILSILFSAAAAMALGALWYSPRLFGARWAKLVGIDLANPDKLASRRAMMIAAAISLIQSFALWKATGGGPVGSMIAGITAGLFFAATALALGDAFERRPLALTLINAGHRIAALAVSGLVIGLFRLL